MVNVRLRSAAAILVELGSLVSASNILQHTVSAPFGVMLVKGNHKKLFATLVMNSRP